MQKITVMIDGSKAPDEAMEEAARAIARLGGGTVDKIGITLTVTDAQAEKIKGALFEEFGKLDARLKMTIKTAIEEHIWGAPIVSETPIERAIRRESGEELGPFGACEYETDDDDEPLRERRA